MFRKAESITKSELLEHYLQKPDATVITACASLNCSYRVLRSALAAHGLVPKDKTRKFGADIRSPLLSNREWFVEQLTTKTLSEIGQIAGRSRNMVAKWRVRHGLPIPPRTRSAKAAIKVLTREQLESAYINDPKATTKSVAELFGVSRGIVERELARNGLATKPKWRHAGRKTEFPLLHDTEWLSTQLATRSLSDVAEELGTDASNVRQQAILQGVLSEPDGTSQAMKEGIAKAGRSRVGENANNWQGGRHTNRKTGYVSVYSPDHPHRRKNNQVFEHRLVMEAHIGRYLTAEEVVHHKNGNRSDNQITNLELVATTGEHVSQHFKASHRVHELETENALLKSRIAELESRLAACTCQNKPALSE